MRERNIQKLLVRRAPHRLSTLSTRNGVMPTGDGRQYHTPAPTENTPHPQTKPIAEKQRSVNVSLSAALAVSMKSGATGSFVACSCSPCHYGAGGRARQQAGERRAGRVTNQTCAFGLATATTLAHGRLVASAAQAAAAASADFGSNGRRLRASLSATRSPAWRAALLHADDSRRGLFQARRGHQPPRAPRR